VIDEKKTDETLQIKEENTISKFKNKSKWFVGKSALEYQKFLNAPSLSAKVPIH